MWLPHFISLLKYITASITTTPYYSIHFTMGLLQKFLKQIFCCFLTLDDLPLLSISYDHSVDGDQHRINHHNISPTYQYVSAKSTHSSQYTNNYFIPFFDCNSRYENSTYNHRSNFSWSGAQNPKGKAHVQDIFN